MRKLALWIASACFAMMAGVSHAQENDAEALSKAAANPLADLISLPFQNNTDFGLGPFDRNLNVLNIQPVAPFAQGRIITRTIFPIVRVPDITATSGSLSSGLSDILFTSFYVPATDKLIWGVGLALEIPAGGEKRGAQKWSAGPSLVLLAQPGNWTLGVLANNVWSFAGKSERQDVNKSLINLFVVYQLGQGWYLNSAPIMAANWEADEGQKWTVPLGGGLGKLAFAGKLPVNMQVGAYANVVKPDVGPEWQLRAQVQVFLPKPGSH